LSLVSTIRCTKHKVMTRATTLTKIAFPQINCNVKETLWRLQEKLQCSRKATFHYKGKVQELFRVGLNESKYDYVDSKQHFYLQYHVATTDMKALCKKQTTLEAGAYLGYTAPGDKLRLSAPHPVRGSIKLKKHCNLMLYLQLSHSKDKVSLLLLLKIYRLFCQKAEKS